MRINDNRIHQMMINRSQKHTQSSFGQMYDPMDVKHDHYYFTHFVMHWLHTQPILVIGMSVCTVCVCVCDEMIVT